MNPDFIPWIATTAISIVGAIIAFNSFKTSRNKLRLDLFPLRFSVFENWKELLKSTLDTAPTPQVALDEFRRHVNESVFLLPDLSEYFLEVHNKALELNLYKGRIQLAEREGRTAPDRDWDKLSELNSWFSKELNEGIYRFAPYLRFDEKSLD